MSLNIHVTLGLAILLTSFQQGASIYCYDCNSANNSACIDFKHMDSEVLYRTIPVVNCDTAVTSPNIENFFCRKIVQTIFHANRDSELRVTRGCGWVTDTTRNCYRADNSDHLETVCQCFTDGCNSADGFDSTSGTILFLLLTAVLYFYR